MRLSRRDFVRATAGGVAAASALGAAEGQRRRPMNVVFIMTDQQPTSTMGCYGNPLGTTPNLDRLANRGVRFDNFYIGAFPCSPSRASMLTGLYPHGHGVITNDVPLSEQVPSMGHLLSAAGYDTGYFGKWHLGGSMYRDLKGRAPHDGNWQFSRVHDESGYKWERVEGGLGEDAPQSGFQTWAGGWKHYHQYMRSVGLGEMLEKSPNIGNHNDAPSGPDSTHSYSQLPEEHHMASFFTQEAERFIRDHQGGETPFGLVLSYFGPHLPVAPPRPWDERYSLEQCPLPANHNDPLTGKPIRQRQNRRCYVLPKWTDEQFQDYIRRYYGYCAYIDHQVGRVMTALTECGLDDNTAVIFTSDHGDMVGAHGFVWKLCGCGYEELSNVPFLMRVPGVTRPGSVTQALGSNVDIMPTLLDLMGLDGAEVMHGKSLAPVLRRPNKGAAQERIFGHWCGQSFMTFDGRWKYSLHWKNRDIDELYDLEEDPGEMTNLAQEEAHSETVAEAKQAIFDWLDETEHEYRDVVKEEAAKEVTTKVIDAEPEVTGFKYLGGSEFEMEVTWHVRGPMNHEEKYWAFTQFINRKYATDGEIAFRFTPWPEPPTTEWEAGSDYTVGPVKVTVPEHAGPGKYAVRSGLWNPDSGQGPGILLNGQGNSQDIGTLEIKKDGDEVTDITYTPSM